MATAPDQTFFDVVVIGGGHAGCEPRRRLRVWARGGAGDASCVDHRRPCPATSHRGLGKGHLVREIDALDELMGRVADAVASSFACSIARKGPAVRGPRAQADRRLYAAGDAARDAAQPKPLRG